MSLSRNRAAQIAIGVLIVIVIRSIAEFFRLRDPSMPPLAPELLLYIRGALGAAVAAFIALVLHAFGRDRSAIMVTAVAIAALLAYKISVMA